MINAIAAIDEKRGIATDKGIPWHIPTDIKYYRNKIMNHVILMGFGMYSVLSKPYQDKDNVVLTHQPGPLRPGFLITRDLDKFFETYKNEDIWIIGGAQIFDQTLDKTDILYITQLEGDFQATKFFPEFRDKFHLVSESEPYTENSTRYTFQVWKSNQSEAQKHPAHPY